MSKKNYPKEQLWYNRKNGVLEPIPDMDGKKLAFKLRLINAKITNHRDQINKLNSLRRLILDTIVSKSEPAKIVEIEGERAIELLDEFIFLSGEERKPVIVTQSTLEANSINLEEMVNQNRIYYLEHTTREDDL